MDARSKAKLSRSLARIEQRIEELCRRIDLRPIVETSSLIPDRQTSGQAQASATVNDLQSDTTNVPSAPPTQAPGNSIVRQARNSESLSASSDNAHLLPLPESASFDLRKWTFYGQSLLPCLSPPAPTEHSPGQTLLDRLEALTEPKAEARLLSGYLLLFLPNGRCVGLDQIFRRGADFLYTEDRYVTGAKH